MRKHKFKSSSVRSLLHTDYSVCSYIVFVNTEAELIDSRVHGTKRGQSN